MKFWIDSISIPEGYINDDKHWVVCKQREYAPASMSIEDAKNMFNTIVDNYAEITHGVSIIQMSVQISDKKSGGALAARAMIDNLHNAYHKENTRVISYYDNIMELAQEYENRPKKKPTNETKIVFSFKWYTDGDFSVRVDEIKNILKQSPLQHLNSLKWYGDGSESGSLDVVFKSADREDCCRSLHELLRILQVSISVIWTHHYIMQELYDMFENAANKCGVNQFKNKLTEPLHVHEAIYGNYEGTEISILVTDKEF